MDNYSSFSITARGYSHILKGTSCEDSSSHYDAEGIHIGVIADGHGDRKCFRSALGSAMAVDIAMADLKVFADSVQRAKDDPTTENWPNKLFEKRSADAIGYQLAQSIILKWLNNVHQHFEANPVLEDEINAAGMDELSIGDATIVPHIYGTTLIAALLTEEYLIVVHQGDGRCVIVHQDGTIDQPVPWDYRCEGRETTSLCDSDAVRSCRYYINNQKENPIIACFVASDGVEDSFESQEEVNAFFGYLTAKYSELGQPEFVNYLAEMLPDFSRLGSRDDVSIAGIINPETAIPYIKKFLLISDLRSHEAFARRAKNKLDSMFRKMEYLTREYEKAKEAYDKAIESNESATKNVDSIIEKLRVANIFKSTSEADRKKAQDNYLAAKEEYEEYSKRHSEFVQMLEEANERIEETKEQLVQLEIDELGKSEVPVSSDTEETDTVLKQSVDQKINDALLLGDNEGHLCTAESTEIVEHENEGIADKKTEE